jgi:hypothetical protein
VHLILEELERIHQNISSLIELEIQSLSPSLEPSIVKLLILGNGLSGKEMIIQTIHTHKCVFE